MGDCNSACIAELIAACHVYCAYVDAGPCMTRPQPKTRGPTKQRHVTHAYISTYAQIRLALLFQSGKKYVRFCISCRVEVIADESATSDAAGSDAVEHAGVRVCSVDVPAAVSMPRGAALQPSGPWR